MPAMREATVYVVDDDMAVRQSLADVLSVSGWRVAQFASAEEFLALAVLPVAPCQMCAIVDVRLPAENGIELQQRLIARGVTLPIIFLTAYDDVPTTVMAMKAGAADFLIKPVTALSLLNAVELALSRAEAEREIAGEDPEVTQSVARLTRRERQVFDLVALGLLNKQIAARLGISMGTVKAHRGRLTRKLAVTTIADLVRLADRVALPAASVDLGRIGGRNAVA